MLHVAAWGRDLFKLSLCIGLRVDLIGIACLMNLLIAFSHTRILYCSSDVIYYIEVPIIVIMCALDCGNANISIFL